jgi:hypothetical protein
LITHWFVLERSKLGYLRKPGRIRSCQSMIDYCRVRFSVTIIRLDSRWITCNQGELLWPK